MRFTSAATLLCVTMCAGVSFGQRTRLLVGTDQGVFANVHAHDYPGLALSANFLPYGSNFSGGARVAGGDVNNDGKPDIITGAGAGSTGGHVKVFSGENNGEIRSFFAYDGFAGGVYVAAGDVNNDGFSDIITGAGSGATGGHVKVFSGQTNAELRSFFAFPGFAGGVRVAAGDVNGDGRADLFAGVGSGGGPQVKVFDAVTNQELRSFFAFGPSFTGGIYVAAGDVNGDGVADIIAGTDAGVPAQINIFNGATLQSLGSFMPFGTTFTGGVRVGAGDIDGDGRADIIAGTGEGAAQLSAFRAGDLQLLANFFPFGGNYSGGIFVAAVPEPTAATALLIGALAAGRRRHRDKTDTRAACWQ